MPRTAVPDDEHAVVESTVINEFLEEAFPAAPALLPSGLWERASQRVLVHRVDSRFIPAGFRYLCYGGDKYEDAWRAELAFWDAALCSAVQPRHGAPSVAALYWRRRSPPANGVRQSSPPSRRLGR